MSWFARGEIEQLRRDLEAERSLRTVAESTSERLRAGLDAVPAGHRAGRPCGVTVLRNRAASVGGHVEVLVEEAVERLLARRLRPAKPTSSG